MSRTLGIVLAAAGVAAVGAASLLIQRPAETSAGVAAAPSVPAVTTPVATRPAQALTPVPAAPKRQAPMISPPLSPVAAAPPEVAPPPEPQHIAPVATPPAEPQRYVPDPAPPAAALVVAAPRVVEPEVQFEELIINKHSVVGLRLDVPVSTRTAQVEDRISATISRDVQVQDRVAIAEGARLEGTIVLVERGGRFRTAPRLGLRFDTVILTDGTRLSIKTETIYREGTSPSADATAKVGAGAVVGGVLGAILGGKKGAAIGGAAGGAAGAAAVMNGDGEDVALRAGAPLTVKLTDDLVVVVRR